MELGAGSRLDIKSGGESAAALQIVSFEGIAGV